MSSLDNRSGNKCGLASRRKPGFIERVSDESDLSEKWTDHISECDSMETHHPFSDHQSQIRLFPGRVISTHPSIQHDLPFQSHEGWLLSRTADLVEVPVPDTEECIEEVAITASVEPLDDPVGRESPEQVASYCEEQPMESERCTTNVPNALEQSIKTFFNTYPHSFVKLELVGVDAEIPVMEFLQACEGVLSILDLMGGRAFAPVKADLQGNISKIRRHHLADAETCTTLQSLVRKELDSKTHNATASATDALLWLKRGLEFMSRFLEELLSSDRETRECAQIAYQNTLERHHNFVVRKLFAVAMYATPYRQDFIATFAVDKTDSQHPQFVEHLTKDASAYSTALQSVLQNINSFYSHSGLPV